MLLAHHLPSRRHDTVALLQADRWWAWLMFLNLTTPTPAKDYSVIGTMATLQAEPGAQAAVSAAVAKELKLAALAGAAQLCTASC